jgi:cytochrome c55X
MHSLAAATAVLLLLTVPFGVRAGDDGERRAALIDLVRHDCGSCHGLTLNGGLGPPLTPEALREQPSENLVATVLHGRPGTPMPPWKRFISEPEARWVVDQLKRGFPHAR